ncbi:dethiobiotin synthase [Pontibacter akesuensis]|uniref:ATP-dependent dethiobiotin synthetase BioD n=1 Tax=Pontibacter akesuensis TaxID=388950 RepID=A0A1I7KFC9_9BACT|nr:dethiobiotin synthase [Pontibacter akesuensis]GHA79556.1 ATP-dependent dethiobiotin synthetase BioD [Pontibacter akesuensis]SFU96211.1 dethiobiotin synthetase [Pontibacter akesuensis]
MKQYFVTGIGTDVGKTVAAAILTEALQADYWKPVQAGGLDFTDTDTVQSLVSNTRSVFHPEAYRLKMASSPHKAAAAEGIEIDVKGLKLPDTQNNLIVEGAGGLMVPLNKRYLVLDLVQQLGLEVVLVSRNYLGSINHTLLTAEVLRYRKIPVAGIIFNGEENQTSEDFIVKYTGLRRLPSIRQEADFCKDAVATYAREFKAYLETAQPIEKTLR